jgi:hypothetical protein
MVNVSHRLLQVVVILLPQLHDSILAVEALTNHLICLDELINFSGQLVILVTDDSNVIVHGVDLHLQIGIVLQKGTVRVAGAFELFSHIQKLVLFLTDLNF